ncbi:Mitochondrial folate transporter/carrier [Trachymyrmex zeteki]|uniref:Solute carrier family 25 member 32 n=1 Tax=Mycetomoellerius zeteki TaxID=64791 RepID=A0A151WZT4_9HYME|nr:Mitochondrial folate transporter/carrier [Trachymyrmex zeteki]
MTAIKGSGTPGTPRQLNVLSNFKYEYFVAGISGGVVSTLMLHPLDLIKIRFAVNDGQTTAAPRYHGLRNAIAQIVKTEGVRGLYRGVTPNVLGSGSSWGFYFFFYNTIKTSIQGGNSKKPLGPSMHMFAAADAGVLTLLMTNPIWVVKTRLCLQYADDVNIAESKKYRGMVDALKKIYRTEGIRGLYKAIPGLFGVSHGAIQFMAYEEMKNKYYNYLNVPIDTKLSTTEYIVFAAMSKLIAAASTYPYQVVRARLQDHHHDYRGTWHCIQCTWRSEGIRGFYKGLSPYLLHVTPNICLIILIYEHFTNGSVLLVVRYRYESWRGFYKGLSVNLARVTPATVITFVVYENMLHYLQSRRATVEQAIAVPAISKLKE